MKKIFKQVTLMLVLLLSLQIAFPFSGSANTTNELERIKQESQLTEQDIQLGLQIISDNSSVFIENADIKVLESYGIADQNVALLKYYYNLSDSTQSLYSFQLEKTDQVIAPRNGLLIRLLIKDAMKDKMGDKIKKQIGKEVEDKVEQKMIDAAEKEIAKNGYSKFVGPKSSGDVNGIKQGEHIFEIYGANGSSIMRGHVLLNPSRNTSVWHYHTKYDNFEYHWEQTTLKHNSLPKWGSK